MKLTKGLREDIASKAAAAIYDSRIDTEHRKMLESAYDTLIASGKYRPVSSIPEGWEDFISAEDDLSIPSGESGVRSVYARLPKPVVTPGATSYVQLGSFHDPWPGQNVYRQLLKQKKAFETELYSVLLSCSTTKQVEATLPELARYLPDDKAPVTALVPVQQVERLRDILSVLDRGKP